MNTFLLNGTGKMLLLTTFDKMDRFKDPEPGEMGWYGKYTKDASMDAWGMYLGIPQESMIHIKQSQYTNLLNPKIKMLSIIHLIGMMIYGMKL